MAGVLPWSIRAPRLRPDALPRTALVERLTSARHRLVLVQAPAGSGKTTLVRQWVEHDDRPASWVNLDSGHNDPVSLVRHLVAALHSSSPVDEAVRVASAPTTDAHDVLAAVDEALVTGPDRLIVLDDLHHLSSVAALAAVDRIADMVPTGSTLVIVARRVPDVRWARRVTGGDTFELGFSDLTFSTDEALDVLRRALPDTDEATICGIVRRTGGWPAALQLATLTVRGGSTPDATSGLTVTNRATLSYFREEVLNGLDEADRHFLVATAVLDEVCGPLADAVIGGRGGGARLERLASSDLMFVTGLGDDGAWFRYHGLFREFLLAELRSTGADHERSIRLRASEWLSDAGHADAAVRQAVASGDRAAAGDLAVRHLFECVMTGAIATVGGWLELIPEHDITLSAELTLCAGWVAFYNGRTDDLIRRMAQLDALDMPSSPDASEEWTRSSVEREALVMTSGLGGAKVTRRAAELLLGAGAPAERWRGTATLLEAVCGYLLGIHTDPREQFQAAAFAVKGQPVAHPVALAQLAAVELIHGDRLIGRRWAAEARREVHDAGLDSEPLVSMVLAVSALATAQVGQAEAARNDRALAEVCLGRLGKGIDRGQAQVRLVLADADLAMGDISDADRLLAAARRHVEAESDAFVLHEWAEELARRITERRRVIGAVEPLTVAETRVLRHLVTHRTLEEIAGELYVSRNTVKSHTVAIYRKLGVTGRSQAVERAQEWGLLEG